jgi:hypothetical protein
MTGRKPVGLVAEAFTLWETDDMRPGAGSS